MTFAALSLDGARFTYPFQLPLEPCNALLHAAAVNFQLGFTWTARADPARLPRQMMPHPSQARQEIMQLCQLDLKSAFSAARSLVENIWNQLCSFENLAHE